MLLRGVHTEAVLKLLRTSINHTLRVWDRFGRNGDLAYFSDIRSTAGRGHLQGIERGFGRLLDLAGRISKLEVQARASAAHVSDGPNFRLSC